MDAAWKVYVGDRRFDDNQISNCFLKMKYETVGRFTFDFRAIDGDESYMVPGNTLRIFWGDLHKMDGVIQRADWDSKQFCYHVYGADIRGFLLDRVNTEPATVSSYTSDVTSQVMFTGCDFPTNIWTGAGESIGKYTFHYKVGIQNTVRVLGATQTRWNTVIERGTVYDHVNGCLYDATKNWEPNALRGATLRFVSGACKNNVYNICGNNSNNVCIRMATETCSQYATADADVSETATQKKVGDTVYNNVIASNLGFEDGVISPWSVTPRSPCTTVITTDAHEGSYAVRHDANGGSLRNDLQLLYVFTTSTQIAPASHVEISFWAKSTTGNIETLQWIETTGVENWFFWHNEVGSAWKKFSTTYTNTTSATIWIVSGKDVRIRAFSETMDPYKPAFDISIDGIQFWVETSDQYYGSTVSGTIPGCSRLGDIYEIVYASMERIEPASILPATLEKDNHIIRYNRVNNLSDHVTSMTVRGA